MDSLTEKTTIYISSSYFPDGNNLSMINQSQTEDLKIDDFKDIFEPVKSKVISLLLWLAYEFLSNTLLGFVIMFEKYGGDPLKRSINNQLITQLCFVTILNNIVPSTLFTWR